MLKNVDLQLIKDLFDEETTGDMVTSMTHLSTSEDVNYLLDADPFAHPKSVAVMSRGNDKTQRERSWMY